MKYSQETLAFISGITQSQISKYETGECIPNIIMLEILANALEIEIFEFFYDSEHQIEDAYIRWKQRIEKV